MLEKDLIIILIKIKDLEAERVCRVLHLDVFIGVVIIINIIGMTTQNQHGNVVIVINVYAKQIHVSNAQSIHIVKVVPIQHVHRVQKKHHIHL